MSELHGAIVGGAIDGGGLGACDGEAGAHTAQSAAGSGFGAHCAHIVGAFANRCAIFPITCSLVFAHSAIRHKQLGGT